MRFDPRKGMLRDRYGRVARDVRVSLTDRCNLRCAYCMPAEPGVASHRKYLTDEEIGDSSASP